MYPTHKFGFEEEEKIFVRPTGAIPCDEDELDMEEDELEVMDSWELGFAEGARKASEEDEEGTYDG